MKLPRSKIRLHRQVNARNKFHINQNSLFASYSLLFSNDHCFKKIYASDSNLEIRLLQNLTKIFLISSGGGGTPICGKLFPPYNVDANLTLSRTTNKQRHINSFFSL